jgi:hypothetical protein
VAVFWRRPEKRHPKNLENSTKRFFYWKIFLIFRYNQLIRKIMKRINIAVMDYSTCSVTLLSPMLVNEETETVEDFLVSEGYHLSNCSYMTTENEITLSVE